MAWGPTPTHDAFAPPRAGHGRIHGFNVSVAHVWAEQERLLDKAGPRMPVEDSW